MLGLRKSRTEHKDDKLAERCSAPPPELTSNATVIRKDIESAISIKQKMKKNMKN